MCTAPESAILPLIREHTGTVSEVTRTAGGFSSDLTAVIHGSRGRFFVKTMRNRPGGRRDSLIRERQINPFLHDITPRLLWDVEDDEWLVLGFEAIDGRPSDFAPDSPDLPLVTEALQRIGALTVPDVARDWAETRWDGYTDHPELLRGNTLLYTDINPSNFLISGQRAWAVDWSWPTRGAGFIDPAIWVVQLIASGHTPAGAEEWAARLPAWQTALPEGLNTFADADLRLYEALAERRPDETWLKSMVDAARSWADHRGISMKA
ncbi:hypothetical protein AQI88_22340 [Streptomyces cellostaticus]|uniref:Protein kinase n=1 Tax=Streptomyces cellostaticus TaxID=67285 RepID=A0A101NJR2_9ACTN|nr:hypothetical protein [Streptomyces cellostaticus]KUM94440.1 hypothetical protein AQI88_22340 [Streptomyces cellostaticus]GHI07195.1 hypothetical protein Scel_55160 [Streptomyces cellostaticus]